MAPPFGVAALCLYHCSPRVAREIRGILTCRCPYLPQPYRLRSHKSAQLSFRYWWQHVARVSFVISLKRTPHGTNWRRPCTPLSSSGKIFNLAFILLSLPVRFPALTQLNRRLHAWWCSPANSFKFQSCDRTSQAACLTASLRHWGGSWPTQHLACIVYGWDYPGI